MGHLTDQEEGERFAVQSRPRIVVDSQWGKITCISLPTTIRLYSTYYTKSHCLNYIHL